MSTQQHTQPVKEGAPTLTGMCREYIGCRTISENYANQLMSYANAYVSFVGEDSLGTLTDYRVNWWLRLLEEHGKSPRTLNSYVRNLSCIWRQAYQDGYIDIPPKRLKRFKVPRKPPTAWSQEEVQKLLEACRFLRGRREWARAYIHVAWSTGLRTGDIFGLSISDVSPEGVLKLSMSKTGQPLTVQLSAEAVESLKKAGGRIEPVNRSSLSEIFRRLVRLSGVRPGTARWLRRSAASYVAREHGVAAAEALLGHLTEGMCRKHYLDPSIVRTLPKSPPKLMPDALKGAGKVREQEEESQVLGEWAGWL